MGIGDQYHPGKVVLPVGEEWNPGGLCVLGLIVSLVVPEFEFRGGDVCGSLHFDAELLERLQCFALLVAGCDARRGLFENVVIGVLVLGEISSQPGDVDQWAEIVCELPFSASALVATQSPHTTLPLVDAFAFRFFVLLVPSSEKKKNCD